MNKAKFREQFDNVPITTDDEYFNLLRFENVFWGHIIYRALDRLVLLENGEYYLSKRTNKLGMYTFDRT